MNMLRCIICFLSLCLVVLSVYPAADLLQAADTFEFDQNILVNGDFEQDLQHPWGTGLYSEGKPVWWNSSSCRSTALVTTETARNGKTSFFIDNPSPRAPHVYGTMAQRIAIRPDQRYRLVLWAGARDLASNGAVNIAVDQKWLVRPVALPAGSYPLTLFDGMFSLPGNFAEVRIISEDQGKVWLDDIRVVPDLNLSVHTAEGSAWSGREGDGWDFVVYQPRFQNNDRIVYKYVAQNSGSGRVRNGEMRVTLFGNHLKAELLDNEGRVRRGYDGTLSQDGSLVWGSCWPKPDSSPAGPKRYGWWATIEKKLPFAAPGTIHLNQASVAQLEAVGFSARSARTIVEGRVLGEPYRSVQEAAKAPRLLQQERHMVENRCVVQ